jgi:hypothetical protein
MKEPLPCTSRATTANRNARARPSRSLRPTPQLLEDGTYYVVEANDEIVACGGWSRRGKLYTGSGDAADDARILAPAKEPARVRVECESAARREGFRELALMSTMPGLPLSLAYGFKRHEDVDIQLPDGLTVAGATMSKPITDGHPGRSWLSA